jgi:sarcosine oxidase/L-pipecolate oxidase
MAPNNLTSTDPATSSILIVGCGTWGSSTALWLARSGYKNVTVLDPYPVPSAISAGNDVNKYVVITSSHREKTH